MIIELLGLMLITVFYYLDLYGAKDFIKIEYVLLSFLVIVALDACLMWWFVVYVSHHKNKDNLQAAEVIGEDIQEVYNFAMIGLVVTDESDQVIWTNDLFITRHIEIIDENIFSWQPSLFKGKEL